MRSLKNKEFPAVGQTVWITKWALTHGIIEAPVEDPQHCHLDQVGILITPNSSIYREDHGVRSGSNRIYYIFKPDWFTNKDDAVKRATKKLGSRIGKLKKELTCLEDLLAAVTRGVTITIH